MLSLALRGWVGLVGVTALVNGVLCYKNPKMIQGNLFNQHPQASDLASRVFGTWNIMSGVVRIANAWDLINPTLYFVTEFSFLLAFVFFLLEVTVYKTMKFTRPVAIPLLISSISSILMLATYTLLF